MKKSPKENMIATLYENKEIFAGGVIAAVDDWEPMTWLPPQIIHQPSSEIRRSVQNKPENLYM